MAGSDYPDPILQYNRGFFPVPDASAMGRQRFAARPGFFDPSGGRSTTRGRHHIAVTGITLK
jgi:hypothetical protein